MSPTSPASSTPHRTNGISSLAAQSPFLKWPGGKRWFVDKHADLLNIEFKKYYEPFLGAGSVFFHLAPKKAVLGDLNADVVAAFTGIREDPKGVHRELRRHHRLHNDAHYYSVRSMAPRSPVNRAARIIYLNRTCFNGIYRVNQQGQFNVPLGNRGDVIRSTDDFEGIAKMLNRVKIYHSDFEPLIDQAELDDLLFLDPPYTVRHNRNGFIKYNERLFSWEDQIRLASATTRAVKRGALVIMTNANHRSIKSLYDKDVFRFKVVSRFSAISATSGSRKSFEELVITHRRN